MNFMVYYYTDTPTLDPWVHLLENKHSITLRVRKKFE